MATDLVSLFDEHMSVAGRYHQKAQWQEKLRTLQDVLKICEAEGFPDGSRRTQQVLFEMGGIRRRFGQYDQAIVLLEKSLVSFQHASPIVRAGILGELGVVYRHKNEFSKARDIFHQQYDVARETALEAEAQLCRAIGNEAMSIYNLAVQTTPPDAALLGRASKQQEERIRRARDLQQRLIQEQPRSKYLHLYKSWEMIGMDRLTLCHIAAGRAAEAVRLAEESQSIQSSDDPTIAAFSRFFYGNALWANNRRDDALRQWSSPQGICGSAMALCKEPSAEHTRYLELLVEAGVDFELYDEQGFSPLDYAVLSDNLDAEQMIKIICNKFRQDLRRTYQGYVPKLTDYKISEMTDKEISARMHQAKLRKHYRIILQEHIRPELRKEISADTTQTLRTIYAKLLAQDSHKRDMFDAFYYVRYVDFKKHGRLPSSNDRMTKKFTPATKGAMNEQGEDFIIFFSYRWIGRTSNPAIDGPDDEKDTQWHRMMNVINEFLKKRPKVNPTRLGIWLVSLSLDTIATSLTRTLRTAPASTNGSLNKGIAASVHCPWP